MIKRNLVIGGLLVTSLALTTLPVLAETAKDSVRIEKLEERVRDIEARMAKVEESSHKKMGMMPQGQHGMGMKDSMGQPPQNPQQDAPTMPQQGGAAPAGAMPPGGMGHM